MDPLRDESTGVFSCAAFEAFGAVTVAQAIRRGSSLALLLVGIDDTRAILEDVTDQVERTAVQTLAGILRRTVRASDIIGRHGPRSFALLAHDVRPGGWLSIAQRIRGALPDRLTVLGAPSPFKVSIGIAILPDMASGFDELLRAAEDALAAARAAGGGVDWLSGATEAAGPTALQAVAAAPSTFEPAEITMRRREGLRAAAAAVQRGQSDGVVIRTAPGACRVCINAARDLYAPGLAPTLPLVGCTNPSGCRCVYALPTQDPRRRPLPLPDDRHRGLKIPRHLSAAAHFGAHGWRGCKAEDLAEYLERFPLLPVDAGVPLRPDEVAYLKRGACRMREVPGVATIAVHGPRIPLDRAPEPRSLQFAGLPSLPRLPNAVRGTLSITNWRILFRGGHGLESVPLADISGVECFRDGIACLAGERDERSAFALKDPLQVGLVLARAIRDLALVPA